MRIDRRDFLRLSIASTLAASFAPLDALSSVQTRVDRRGRPKRVTVIGAGLAGLVAAYELTKAGHDVIILEAQSRPGGRVLTLRTPFADGLYADAGATRIPGWHALPLQYAKLFDLTLVPFGPADAPDGSPDRHLADIWFLRGQRIRTLRDASFQWAPDVPQSQRVLTPSEAEFRYTTPLVERIRDPRSTDWLPEQFAQYDHITEIEHLRRQGVAPAVLDWLSMDRIPAFHSFLHLLRQRAVTAAYRQEHNITRDQYWKIAGGNDLLPMAFAMHLSSKIRYGSPVVRIEHTENNVGVVIRRPGGFEKLSAERLICTIPFTMLRRVEIEPSFSPGKRKAIAELPYTSSTKVFLQTRTQYWLSEGLSGFVTTDHPMQIWNLSYGQASQRGVLAAYVIHHNDFARRVAAMSEDQRLSFAAREVERVLPGLRDVYEAGISKCWDQDEWVRGAVAFYLPGQVTTLMPFVAQPEGRVHFAGEHTSTMPGWMQGALESGLRAATEVNESA